MNLSKLLPPNLFTWGLKRPVSEMLCLEYYAMDKVYTGFPITCLKRLCRALESHGTETVQRTWESWYRDYASHLRVMVQRLCSALGSYDRETMHRTWKSWYREYAVHLRVVLQRLCSELGSYDTETMQSTLRVMVQRLCSALESRIEKI